jgi:peptide/nickel transport system substrate-binding protein
MSKPIHILSALLLSAVLFLSACQPAPASTNVPGLGGGDSATPTAAFTPTALPTRVLGVCIGEQPNTLFPFANLNGAARSVLAAVYDGPYDMLKYEPRPVILQKIPSLNDDDAQVNSVTVAAGDKVVDAEGNLILLKVGSRVRPAGCRSSDCVLTYDGVSPVSMDQMFVEFRILPGVMWSDGTVVTAEDSVYAYDVAQKTAEPGATYIFDRTKSYDAADETTIQWWGIPGFVDPTFYSNFWTPLPKHLWSQFSITDLKTMDLSARLPMGYGAYVLKEWDGDTLRLAKNPFYFRTSEGLPHFDELIFRVTPDPDAAMSALIEGRCDLIDSTVHLDAQVSLLLELRRTGQTQSYFGQTPTLEWLAFGVTPASYDDRYDPVVQKDRPDFFGDPRLRQAVAYCLDRQKVVDSVLYGLVPVPDTYVSADHPMYTSEAAVYPYDPAAGIKILENLGWADHDLNPATPRQAIGVDRVPPNTQLVVTYLTTSATQRRQVAEILSASLQQCGIGLTVAHISQSDFYAPGPAGLLFGRAFDMAEFAMSTTTAQPPCARFTTSEIPAESNHWVGTNVSGYKNPLFDATCLAARQSLPGEETYLNSYRQTQVIFSNDLPAIPLYNRLEIAAARYDFCNFQLDPTAATDLFAIESFDYGDACADAP